MTTKDVLLLPDLFAIACTTLVLLQVRGKRAPDGLGLWITGLVLIVAECVARLFYQMYPTGPVHSAMHVLSLETYFLAGLAFFQSATGRLRFLKHSRYYVTVLATPHCAMLLLYGYGVAKRVDFLILAGAGLLGSLTMAALLRRPRLHMLCHVVVWAPFFFCAAANEFRACAYLSLFFVYVSTSIAFYFTIPSRRRGRVAVVAAFFVWSLCFVTHPWIAQVHRNWLPVVEQIWNLQKFFITFGLLIVALDEQMTTNEHRALHDTLTGLPNRRFFEERLAYELADATRSRGRLLLFNMDLNDFKMVNDDLGHDAGDQLLRQISRRLQASVRSADTLARMGGDEFNLLLADSANPATRDNSASTYAERARRIAGDLRRVVSSTPYELEVGGRMQSVSCSISIGWSMFPDDGIIPEELSQTADSRMYADKRGPAEGGNVVAMQSRRDARERSTDRVTA